jgi:YidC/Oxa1 family membrane protein insertase
MNIKRLLNAIMITVALWLVMQYFFPINSKKPDAPTVTTTHSVSRGSDISSKPTSAVSDQTDITGEKSLNDSILLGNPDKKLGYRVFLTLTNQGAAMRKGTLTEFSPSVRGRKADYNLLSEVSYPTGIEYSMTTQKLTITPAKGKTLSVWLDQAKWFYKKESSPDNQTAKFWIDINVAPDNIVRVTKIYTVKKQSYDVLISMDVQNLTDQPIVSVVRQQGPIGVPREDQRYEDRKVFGGIFETGSDIVRTYGIDRKTLEGSPEFTKLIGAPEEEKVWVGGVNKYFAAVLSAVDEKGNLNRKMIDTIEARAYSSDPNQGDDLTSVWVTKQIAIPKGKSSTIRFELFLGPKWDNVFSEPKYAARNYMGLFEHSWCTMQWLADVMTWMLKSLYFICRNYGLAIVLLVVIVRVALHPVSKSSQVNMMKMQDNMKRLQPKLAALKEKHKNNREAINQATMQLYKDEGVNPAGQMLGCLPMFLQMPIWVALWTALNNAFELRHQPLLPWVPWMRDLAGPDALIYFSRAYDVPLLSLMMGPFSELNLLPIIMMVSMFLQQKLTPQPASSVEMDPAQQKQQKFMMYFMSIFMGLILYNAPSGLNLYILTSNFLGIVESRRIRKHLEEEAKRQPEKLKNKQPSWWERIQKRAEVALREIEKKG